MRFFGITRTYRRPQKIDVPSMIQHELTGGLKKSRVKCDCWSLFRGGGGAGQAFTQHYACSINILRLHLQRRV